MMTGSSSSAARPLQQLPLLLQDTPELFQRRIQACRADDVLAGLFLESTLTYMEQLAGEEAAQALRKEVLGSQPLVGFFRYPASSLLRLVGACAQRMPASESFHQRVALLGRNVMSQFFTTQVGKMLQHLSGGDVHRLLLGSGAGYKAVTSYTVPTYTRVGERAVRLHYVRDMTGPAWATGVLQEGLRIVCDVQLRVRTELLDDMGADYIAHLEW
jgi:uncharacterized protein (TIGR02265 family)